MPPEPATVADAAPPDPHDAGQWLRALRQRRRLSQRELAAEAGLPASTVSRIESGATDPKFSTFTGLLARVEHHLVVLDSYGRVILPDPLVESISDRGGRHHPGHLRSFKTPNYASVHYRDWWGWDRIAWAGDRAPEFTYWRRSAREQKRGRDEYWLRALCRDAT